MGLDMVHAGPSMVSIEWVFLLVVIIFVSLLILFNAKDKEEPKKTSNKRIKEIMEKGGYIVIDEDDSGNLMFKKVCYVSESSIGEGRT